MRPSEEPQTPHNTGRHRLALPGLELLDEARRAPRWIAAVRFAHRHNRTLGHSARTLHFFPMRPNPMARISLIVARLGLRVGNGPHPTEPTMAWHTGTWLDRGAQERLPPDAINGRCADISKSHVDRVWESVAGYGLEVDPLTTDGVMVVKSEFNGRHDGRIVSGPQTARRPGLVYQRFIDAIEGDQLVNLRTTVANGEIVAVIRRLHPMERWFAWSTSSTVADAAAELSGPEQAMVLQFADRLGLDYGELDIMRDRPSGRLFVVDANRTPYGPSLSESPAVLEHLVATTAEALARLMAERWP
jgi:hypothetical protein